MEYFKLNDTFNDFLNEGQNEFYVSNLDLAVSFLKKGRKKINLFKLIGSNVLNLKLKEKVSGIETLDLVTKFLSNLGEDYLEYFKESFNNGYFDFHNSFDEDEQNIKNQCNNKNYSVKFTGTINDSTCVIHEFFHSLNSSNSKVAPVFSEVISIYMENKFLDFLIENGYSRTDVAKSRILRYIDFWNCHNELSIESDFLNLKNHLGYLDENSYSFINEHSKELNFYNMKKEDFLMYLNYLNKLMDNKKFNPDYSFRYFIGTAYSSYLLMQDDSLDKVLALNEYMMQPMEYTDVETAFRILGIKQKDDTCFIKATNEYYQKEALIYKNNNSKQLNQENALHI